MYVLNTFCIFFLFLLIESVFDRMMSVARKIENKIPIDDAGLSRADVWKMFDRIASRYDFLNRLLSFRQDVRWRRKVTAFLPEFSALKLLDVATGTGDLLFSLQKNSPRVVSGVGIDLSEKMLEIGRAKLDSLPGRPPLSLQKGDATAIPFPAKSFHAVTIAFGIRNVTDVNLALREMFRVLCPGGRAIILEFSLPENFLVRAGYLFYFRNILPKIGGLVSGDAIAYRYLNETVESFPYGKRFCALMTDAGFQNVGFKSLTFGVASIYYGDKPKPAGGVENNSLK